MKYRNLNKYEKKEIRRNNINALMSGEGEYIFENLQNADLTLPRPTKAGVRVVKPRERFQGDSYYKQLVPSFLKIIEVIRQEDNMEDKLILEQPYQVTEKGVIEHFVAKKDKPVTEVKESEGPVLLNENPDPDGFVIVDEN